MIYLDNAATTKPLDSLFALFGTYIQEAWYNPSSLYPPAVEAERSMNRSRAFLCDCIHAPHAIFTSGGTEAANTVIQLGYRKRGSQPLHFITSLYEHPCVYESFVKLQEAGHSVDFVRPDKTSGTIEAQTVADLVRADTALVSIMHVQNETGAVNDITAIAAAVKQKNSETLFHSDGVQGFLRIGFDMENSLVDYYTASAHKLHGLKGTGILFYKKGTPLKAVFFGGGQELSLRPGTENTFGIAAFEHATKTFLQSKDAAMQIMQNLHEKLTNGLVELGATLLSPTQNCAPYIVNVAFPGLRGEVLLHLLEAKGIYIATGSACSSKKRTFRVQEALGYGADVAECAVRYSLSSFTTEAEIETTLIETKKAVSGFAGFIRR